MDGLTLLDSGSAYKYSSIGGGGQISQPIEMATVGHESTSNTLCLEIDTNSEFILPIDRLPANNYVLKKPIEVIITYDFDGDFEYIANFPEAEIATSGDTLKEALTWLTSTIVDTYELFTAQRRFLGPLPRRQLKALEKYVAKKQN